MNFQKLLEPIFNSINHFWKRLGLVQDLAVVLVILVEVVLVVHLVDLTTLMADLAVIVDLTTDLAVIVDLTTDLVIIDLMTDLDLTTLIDQGLKDASPVVDINIKKKNFIFSI